LTTGRRRMRMRGLRDRARGVPAQGQHRAL